MESFHREIHKEREPAPASPASPDQPRPQIVNEDANLDIPAPKDVT